MENTPEILQKAYQLIKNGEKNEALALLTPIIRADPKNADAWYLIGHALTDHEKRIYAFEQVLRFDPSNEAAQKQLAKLRPAPEVEPATAETPISLDAPITPEVLAKNTSAANAELRKLLPWVGGIVAVLCLCLGVVAVSFWGTIQGALPAPAAVTVSATATQTLMPGAVAVSPTVTRNFSYTATQRPSVTPYPRRATGTPIPTSTEPVTMLTVAVPTPILTLVVIDLPISKKLVRLAKSVSKAGSLSPGQNMSIPIDIDNAGDVDFVLNWPVKQPIVFTLTTPNGKVIDEKYAKENPAFAVFTSTKKGFSYTIKASAAGEWKMNLAASGPGQYEVLAQFLDTPLTFRAGGDKLKYVSGALANIAARLEDDGVGLPGVTVLAKVKVGKLAEQAVSVVDMGDGFYGLTYTVPRSAGSAPIVFTFTASGENKGYKFTRVTTFSFEVTTKP